MFYSSINYILIYNIKEPITRTEEAYPYTAGIPSLSASTGPSRPREIYVHMGLSLFWKEFANCSQPLAQGHCTKSSSKSRITAKLVIFYFTSFLNVALQIAAIIENRREQKFRNYLLGAVLFLHPQHENLHKFWITWNARRAMQLKLSR